MAPLATPLRKLLEGAIKNARQVAERGAKQALESLAVDRHEPHGSMTPEQRELRNRLRAHGRQLGDARDKDKGTQAIARLMREVAYEHWHRMLFARFLAENGLLIEPTHGVAVTLAECEELARERSEDPWLLAARFAQRMLPAIFRPDDPALAVTLPPEVLQELERLLAALPPAVFTSDDALGWTYQFWQAAEKEAVNARVKSGEKITGETLPAVTQLFTEHYMVLFLLHNTLGAWHAGKVLAERPELAQSATSETELRRAVALPGCEWEYLRFVRKTRDEEEKPSGPWRPAAGTFPTWPKRAAELKVLDPCCGSGHFLVAAFEILVRLRMAEEGLSLEPAIRAVLAENLFGLELDARCTQIAAFNLALAAWKWMEKPIELPRLQVACCGLGPAASKTEWLRLAEAVAAAGGMPAKRDLFGKDESLLSEAVTNGLSSLHELFSRAPELGSLIDPAAISAELFRADFKSLEPLLASLLARDDDDLRERAVAAAGMTRAARILVGPSGGYTLVVTNVPFLQTGAQSKDLVALLSRFGGKGRKNLATSMLARGLGFARGGTVAVVCPQDWLYKDGYLEFRLHVLKNAEWHVLSRLGAGAFNEIGGEEVKVALWVASSKSKDLDDVFSHMDAQGSVGSGGKADFLLRGAMVQVSRSSQAANPKAVVAEELASGGRLSMLATFHNGICCGDQCRFMRGFWELPSIDRGWSLMRGTVKSTQPFGGMESAFYWEDGKGQFCEFVKARLGVAQINKWIRGHEAWGRDGVLVSAMGRLPVSRYLGELFDESTVALLPKSTSDLAMLWTFVSSPGYSAAVRRMDASLKVRGPLVRVPFDRELWKKRSVGVLGEPQSDVPTQWVFHGHPAGMLAAGPISRSPVGLADAVGADRHSSLICREPNPRDVLQVAVARLLGYRWPPEHDETMRLDVAARAWVSKCRELDAFAADDGIVCLTPVHGEPAAADRLRKLLTAAFANVPGGFTAARERELVAAAANEAEPADSLDEWLREQFFEQHCALFHSRPFVWHVWDGRKDGFGALVNYHRLAAPNGEGRRTLESLAFTYLGEWIARQKDEQTEGREGADGRLKDALRLQTELKKILEGVEPYDLFVRWKPLHEQPIGWEPDINDGVRLNIRPFLLAKDMGRKGSGLLRVRPKSIKWDNTKVDKPDRGKEPESLRPRLAFPWFWGCDPEEKPEHRTDFGSPLHGSPAAGRTFDGKRWNDLHYTRAAKEAARAAVRQDAAT